MAKVDSLSAAIMAELKKYSNKVAKSTKKAVNKVTDEALAEVKANSPESACNEVRGQFKCGPPASWAGCPLLYPLRVCTREHGRAPSTSISCCRRLMPKDLRAVIQRSRSSLCQGAASSFGATRTAPSQRGGRLLSPLPLRVRHATRTDLSISTVCTDESPRRCYNWRP